MDRAEMISKAKGDNSADLLIKNVQVVNVLSGEVHGADVGIADGFFLGFGCYEAREVIDADGKFMCPGLVEGHIHIESTLLTPPEFARAVACSGTSAVVADPHEIANVLGREGIKYMLNASEGLPVSIYFMMPSCIPATHMETAGAVLTHEDVKYFLDTYPDRILGLAEMMNFPGVVFKDKEVLSKLEAAGDKIIDGHAPMLSGKDLNAYIIAGPRSDHECTTIEEAREKLRAGMHIMMRQGSFEITNMEDLLPLVNDNNWANISIVSDDRSVTDLRDNGHLNYAVRRAVELGMNPVRAIQMASVNTARYFGLKRHGAIAPGYFADFLLLNDLKRFEIERMFLRGRDASNLNFNSSARLPGNTMHIRNEITPDTFAVTCGKGKMRVIGIVHGSLITKNVELEPLIEGGFAVADPGRDVCKVAVFERHKGTGNGTLGFATGLGLKSGAIAGSVAHDSHNLIVAGVNDRDMAQAANRVREKGGGFVACHNGTILAELPLPVAGLMSSSSMGVTAAELDRLEKATTELGCLANPFMIMSFLALPVIPSLKITDKGLVDVDKFDFTSSWTG